LKREGGGRRAERRGQRRTVLDGKLEARSKPEGEGARIFPRARRHPGLKATHKLVPVIMAYRYNGVMV